MTTRIHFRTSLLTAAIVLTLTACQTQNVEQKTPVKQDDAQQQVLPEPVSQPGKNGQLNDSKRKNIAIKEDEVRHLAVPNKQQPLPEIISTDRSAVKLRGRVELQSAKPSASVGLSGLATSPIMRSPSEPLDRENYHVFDDNGVQQVASNPVSTFSIDVDTGAYANVRRFLNQGNLPRKNAVRVEEMINYFNYDYAYQHNQHPFSTITELAPTPWNPKSHLLHVGIQGDPKTDGKTPDSNLVFLIDVSGSMRSANKLDLLKTSLKLLTKQLGANDNISLVVYAGSSGVVLPPTAGNQTATINQAIDNLVAGGSTNGAAGIRLAYQMAQQGFVKNGINRILLATDGDFNVGTISFDALKDLVEEKRKTGISLTTLGFGTGNYNDHLMEQLADKGNGNYAYIDTIHEAQKVLVDERKSTLQTIAKDVKIQIEFNPASVAEYRLIGYENRALKREDFNNDKVDAGEIGAGHSVTALYEVVLTESGYRQMDQLRYQPRRVEHDVPRVNELAYLKIRYKAPNGTKSTLIEQPVGRQHMQADIKATSNAFQFASAVAAFGQQLRGGRYTSGYSLEDTLNLASKSKGQDRFGYRGEFLRLVRLAKSLKAPLASNHRE